MRQTFQIALNKRINDQLREYQLLELKHAKEKFELEMAAFEEESAMKLRQSLRLFETKVIHVDQHHMEKELIRSNHEAEKLQKLERSHLAELKRLSQDHRIALRQLKVKQHQRFICLPTS